MKLRDSTITAQSLQQRIFDGRLAVFDQQLSYQKKRLQGLTAHEQASNEVPQKSAKSGTKETEALLPFPPLINAAAISTDSRTRTLHSSAGKKSAKIQLKHEPSYRIPRAAATDPPTTGDAPQALAMEGCPYAVSFMNKVLVDTITFNLVPRLL
jgi:hypothetical protein